jgi:hypothetical protein
MSAVDLALGTVNAPRPCEIDAASLLVTLQGGPEREQWRMHLLGFFEEVPLPIIARVISEAGLDPASVLQTLRELRSLGVEAGDVEAWLVEQAGGM